MDHGPVRGTMVIRPYGYRIWELLQGELDRRIKATGHVNAYFPILIPKGYLQRRPSTSRASPPNSRWSPMPAATSSRNRSSCARLRRPSSARCSPVDQLPPRFAAPTQPVGERGPLGNAAADVPAHDRVPLAGGTHRAREVRRAHARDDAVARALRRGRPRRRGHPGIPGGHPGNGSPGRGEPSARGARARRTGAAGRQPHYIGTNFAQVFDIQYAAGVAAGTMPDDVVGHVDAHDRRGDHDPWRRQGLDPSPGACAVPGGHRPVGRGEQADSAAARPGLAAGLRGAGPAPTWTTGPSCRPVRFNDWEKGASRSDWTSAPGISRRLALMSTRLGAGKTPVPLDSAPARLPAELAQFQRLLRQRATEFRDSRTRTVHSWAEFAEAVAAGWALAFHCGTQECEDDIKAATTATPRCIPSEGPAEEGRCVRCDLPSRIWETAHLRPGVLTAQLGGKQRMTWMSPVAAATPSAWGTSTVMPRRTGSVPPCSVARVPAPAAAIPTASPPGTARCPSGCSRSAGRTGQPRTGAAG